MALDNITIQKKLQATFGEAVVDFHEQHGMLVFEVSHEKAHDIIQFLKEDEEMGFNFLTDVCGVNYAEEVESRQLAVVYHLHNWFENVRVRIKTYLSIKNPVVDTVSDLYKSANWQERETYDFYGITFKGHPQLKRILNVDTMESFPLRKEHPMEDAGRTDKDDRFFGRTVHNC
ncbi:MULTISPECIES: NADH-quinone oxidoreductase subunit C [Myroides]|uniref:NADH-quinone oxidoreductase subunit C n=1 Tax=Myroides albus TaxID=2562892 RepID=A0A6I3LFN1_9FLAO|nr:MULTISPECIES: NADH-quinone oxidoreductase subunit C [Myroides]MTG96717.1 NADH-quinone oxidoreductase subunit C [Myroides albus]MVX35641.1 NADH-quinone oxidoreductase subunit C [Myroides sp. LoEW2-1]UVD80871.1 NADH-quinone oxidoreductase subunit C [Myroides albus]